MQKKSQAQIITTILIILLVLAAVVIVWQVVQSTIKEGAEEIEDRSKCIGLTVEITNIDTALDIVTIKPNKDIDGFRVYVNGALNEDPIADGTAVTAFSTQTTGTITAGITTGQEITTAGLLGEIWCDGLTKEIAPAP